MDTISLVKLNKHLFLIERLVLQYKFKKYKNNTTNY